MTARQSLVMVSGSTRALVPVDDKPAETVWAWIARWCELLGDRLPSAEWVVEDAEWRR